MFPIVMCCKSCTIPLYILTILTILTILKILKILTILTILKMSPRIGAYIKAVITKFSKLIETLNF